MTRAPVEGQVKTRLIPALGETSATELHRRMIEHAVNNGIAAEFTDIELHCSPDIHHPFFQYLAAEYDITLVNQQGHDLGQRMFHALSSSLKQDRPCLLIGTDCPVIDRPYLQLAADSLETAADVVLGPAEDGGYVLIGVKYCTDAIFCEIDWSTERVLEQTLDKLDQSNLNYRLIDTLWDIDRADDYQRLQQQSAMAHLHTNLEAET